MSKVKLYIESTEASFLDFCHDASIGAKDAMVPVTVEPYYDYIPSSPYSVLVGSVEYCKGWLEENQYEVPAQIDMTLFDKFLGRKVKVIGQSELALQKFPLFVKPASQIKAFTGILISHPNNISYSIDSGYQGGYLVQEVIDVVSEYRLYVNNNRILGMKHYQGDCLVFPDPGFIKECLGFSKTVLDYHSYTLDFGVLSDGSTVLVEPNDGWAIGNYGLPPKDYYRFVRDRWLQITKVRTKMDYHL